MTVVGLTGLLYVSTILVVTGTLLEVDGVVRVTVPGVVTVPVPVVNVLLMVRGVTPMPWPSTNGSVVTVYSVLAARFVEGAKVTVIRSVLSVTTPVTAGESTIELLSMLVGSRGRFTVTDTLAFCGTPVDPGAGETNVAVPGVVTGELPVVKLTLAAPPMLPARSVQLLIWKV